MTYHLRHIITVFCACLLFAQAATAQFLDTLLPAGDPQESKAPKHSYSTEHPLVYEGAQDLWPYSFVNEHGQPCGYNIDLIKLLLDELGIPYTITMKPRLVAFKDLKEGRSNLLIDLTAGFHDTYGYYGKNTVTLFTQSLLSPKKKPTNIHNFRDLANHKVYVNDSSLCHHLMMGYGWGDNAIPTRNISETIQQISLKEEGELVWNTLSLKWLLRKYHIDNLQITPVDMPHGEYKFISNDKHLIHLLDSVLTEMNATDKLLPLQTKWFYPERQETKLPMWLWYAGGIFILLVLIFTIYAVNYHIHGKRITQENNRRNRRLALVLETSQVHIWTYDVATKLFTWRNEYGQPAYTYRAEEFSERYSPKDFELLYSRIQQLAEQSPDDNGEDKEIVLNIKARDTENDRGEMRDVVIHLSVLNRDKQGNPTVIIGTKRDVTERNEKKRQAEERTTRYWAIFNTPLVGILVFDKDGIITDLNDRACEMFECNREAILQERVTFSDLLDTEPGLTLPEADNYYATQVVTPARIPAEQRRTKSVKRKEKLFNEFRLITVYDEDNVPTRLFAICHDVTYLESSIEHERQTIQKEHEVESILKRYVKVINHLLAHSDLRMVRYSPSEHTVTINDRLDHVQHALTQTRCMTLIDSSMQIKAMRLLSEMDARTNKTFSTDIRTKLRARGSQYILHLEFHLEPVFDEKGSITEYFGICRDISELKSIEQDFNVVKAKTQEIEDTKTGFMRNMMEEIRTPLDNMIQQVSALGTHQSAESENEAYDSILNTAGRLTHIINGILTLSRIEAHMVEIKKQPTDFTQVLETYCTNGWKRFQHKGVNYSVESNYEQLVVDIDAEQLGNVIERLAANAAQYTHEGSVLARYDYIGRRLLISIDDTGTGISKEVMARLRTQMAGNTNNSSGLGLTICNELVKQMGGTIEIDSVEGVGTTVWISLYCQASIIKRKKIH